MPRHVVVISFDHLHLGYLGCYGNEWVETPTFDQLAARAVVFDGHFAANLTPGSDHPWWTGINPIQGQPLQPANGNLIQWLQSAGIHTTLVVEDDRSGGAAVTPAFDEIVTVRVQDADELTDGETPFAQLVGEVCQRLAAGTYPSKSDSLLWIKSRGVPTPWIPPIEYVDLYYDELGVGGGQDDDDLDDDDVQDDKVQDDDEPEDGESDWSDATDEETTTDDSLNYEEYEYVRPGAELRAEELPADGPSTDGIPSVGSVPVEELDEPDDDLLARVAMPDEPDLLPVPQWDEEMQELQMARAWYASYVTHLDRWLGKLLHAIDQRPEFKESLVIVTAAAGSHVGERGLETQSPPPLEETIHVPLLLRLPTRERDGNRVLALTQTTDLLPTVGEWLGLKPEAVLPTAGRSLLPIVREEPRTDRQAVLIGDEQYVGLRTAEFYYLRPRDAARVSDEESEPLLFHKPADRWDRQNVIHRQPGRADELDAQLTQAITP